MADAATQPADYAQLSAAVTSAQQGDEESFRLLYRSLHPHLHRYLYTLVGQDAEDVASEAWLQIARDFRSFRGDYNGFRGWAVTIARNRALDHVRRHQRRPVEAMPIEHLLDAADGQDTAMMAIDSIATWRAVAQIASLPQEQAEVVMLRVVLGLDVQAVARILGKRAGAVRVAAHRGLRRLADQLANPASGGP